MSSDESPPSGLGAPESHDDLKPILSPILPSSPASSTKVDFIPLVTVVGFHHARGPEVENWFGADEGSDPAADYGWSLLPFMALSDGAHASEEDFSYFTLLRPETETKPATSLFGISCTRQLDSSQLINRPADVTRSTVQKAVVVIADSPQFFGMLRERLSIVTQAWFAQREFTDVEILRRFQESLADEKTKGILNDQGSLFGPYTPLQQLDILADFGTKSYIVGSTNSLLLQQKDRYSDILINLDEDSVVINSPSLRSALTLTAADRRWIDYLTHEINETWDEANPSRPKTLKYVGSEEFIRLQFEEYILALISSVKYHNYLNVNPNNPKAILPEVEGDPVADFGYEWVEAWKRTENYRMWNTNTDSHLFDIVDPRHPCAGGLNIEDVQRRIAEQVKELHLDERFAQGKEVLGRNLAAGREKASFVLNKLYADMEALREAQRRRAEEARAASPPNGSGQPTRQDPAKAGQQGQSAGSRAGAYIGSWAAWAGEKRRTSGWGASWSRKPAPKADKSMDDSSSGSPIDKDYQMISAPVSRGGSSDDATARPGRGASFSESILSGVSESGSRPTSGINKPLPGPPVPEKKDDGFQTEGVVGSKDKLPNADPPRNENGVTTEE
ncbi:hypothetical protein FGADI_2864 [Fusarium gaditjirri]|uniref:AVL9/DENND6 domain-containing protein n=1 Tax=Fusarium gaditjirri TaxID=282569 RepID=A0A8H4TH70_9HYPO|nr:hypothetical protein FGADI_2864 [Fusarium gaditjirri]